MNWGSKTKGCKANQQLFFRGGTEIASLPLPPKISHCKNCHVGSTWKGMQHVLPKCIMTHCLQWLSVTNKNQSKMHYDMVTISMNVKAWWQLLKKMDTTKLNLLKITSVQPTDIHYTIKELRCHEVSETSRNSYVWRREEGEGWHRWPWVTEWRSRMGKAGSDKTWTCWQYRARYAQRQVLILPDNPDWLCLAVA